MRLYTHTHTLSHSQQGFFSTHPHGVNNFPLPCFSSELDTHNPLHTRLHTHTHTYTQPFTHKTPHTHTHTHTHTHNPLHTEAHQDHGHFLMTKESGNAS